MSALRARIDSATEDQIADLAHEVATLGPDAAELLPVLEAHLPTVGDAGQLAIFEAAAAVNPERSIELAREQFEGSTGTVRGQYMAAQALTRAGTPGIEFLGELAGRDLGDGNAAVDAGLARIVTYPLSAVDLLVSGVCATAEQNGCDRVAVDLLLAAPERLSTANLGPLGALWRAEAAVMSGAPAADWISAAAALIAEHTAAVAASFRRLTSFGIGADLVPGAIVVLQAEGMDDRSRSRAGRWLISQGHHLAEHRDALATSLADASTGSTSTLWLSAGLVVAGGAPAEGALEAIEAMAPSAGDNERWLAVSVLCAVDPSWNADHAACAGTPDPLITSVRNGTLAMVRGIDQLLIWAFAGEGETRRELLVSSLMLLGDDLQAEASWATLAARLGPAGLPVIEASEGERWPRSWDAALALAEAGQLGDRGAEMLANAGRPLQRIALQLAVRGVLELSEEQLAAFVSSEDPQGILELDPVSTRTIALALLIRGDTSADGAFELRLGLYPWEYGFRESGLWLLHGLSQCEDA